MSLQVWLPLNGNLNNQGLDPLNSLSASSVTFADGKIGKCLNNNGIKTTTGTFTSLSGCKEYTLAVWLKINTATTNTSWADIVGLKAQYDDWVSILRIEHTSTNGAFQLIHGKSANHGTSTNTYWGLGSSTTAAKDQWCHICLTNDGTYTKFYLNGELKTTVTNTSVYKEHYLTGEIILGRTGSYSMLNDLRIYDNVISLKEIHLLSQGLFVHYPLRDPYIEATENIINQPVKTGATSTTIGWDNDNHIGAITVSGWASGYNSGVSGSDGTKNPEEGYHAHWIEMDGIPTIKFPNLNKVLTGNNRWLEVSQSGEDLSSIIGPETVYTISFDAMSTVPGMDVRMGYYFYNTSGSRSFHDGYCIASTTTSWKRYTKTITCNSAMDNTKTAYFYIYGHNADVQGISYVRNIQVEVKDHSTGFVLDINEPDTCYDCSGFGNHANIIGSVESHDVSARNDRCLFIEDGCYDYLKTDEITIPTDAITLSCWFNASEAGYSNYHIPINFGSGYCEMSVDSNGKIRSGFYAPSRNVGNGANTSVLDGEWHLLTTTFDGTTIKRYVDGVATTSTAIASAPRALQYSTGNLFIGNYNGTTYGNKNAKMCDVRLYATALSAEDILELYNTPITITNNQSLITNEFKEVE